MQEKEKSQNTREHGDFVKNLKIEAEKRFPDNLRAQKLFILSGLLKKDHDLYSSYLTELIMGYPHIFPELVGKPITLDVEKALHLENIYNWPKAYPKTDEGFADENAIRDEKQKENETKKGILEKVCGILIEEINIRDNVSKPKLQYFDYNEDANSFVTPEGRADILESLRFECEEVGSSKEISEELIFIVDGAIETLNKFGFTKRENAEKIQEIFYWSKLGV